LLVVAGLRSVEDEDGVAVGLAESFARGGDATLLVDADLRSGRASEWLGVAGARATPYDDDFVDEPARPYAPVSVVVDRDRAFDFLPAPTGVRHPVDRLVRLFGEQREAWLRDYDVVIVAAAPLLPTADALAVAAHADGVVLCARRGRTSRAELERALSLLNEQRAPVVGTVLTHAASSGGTRAGDRLRPRAAASAATVAGSNVGRRG
jgi:Mrp family chromosome partitioning ATPase